MVGRARSFLPVVILNPASTVAVPTLVPFKESEVTVSISYVTSHHSIGIIKMMRKPTLSTEVPLGPAEIFEHVALGAPLSAPQTRH
jgi:hypothetical protein